MLQSAEETLLDEDLHHAINLLQIIVLDLESLKQSLGIAGTSSESVIEAATQYAFECSDLLHEVRRESRALARSNPVRNSFAHTVVTM